MECKHVIVAEVVGVICVGLRYERIQGEMSCCPSLPLDLYPFFFFFFGGGGFLFVFLLPIGFVFGFFFFFFFYIVLNFIQNLFVGILFKYISLLVLLLFTFLRS